MCGAYHSDSGQYSCSQHWGWCWDTSTLHLLLLLLLLHLLLLHLLQSQHSEHCQTEAETREETFSWIRNIFHKPELFTKIKNNINTPKIFSYIRNIFIIEKYFPEIWNNFQKPEIIYRNLKYQSHWDHYQKSLNDIICWFKCLWPTVMKCYRRINHQLKIKHRGMNESFSWPFEHWSDAGSDCWIPVLNAIQTTASSI